MIRPVTNAFSRFELRTTDVDIAREFYVALFGPAFWSRGIDITTLPPQAIARGAVPHWLGHIAVDDVEESAVRFVQRGATALGPGTPAGRRAILRDPFGAIVALASDAEAAGLERVAWHVLHTNDEARAWAVYADLFHWTAVETSPLGAEAVRYRTFSWNGAPVGSIANTAALPHVHPHWLFFFRTEQIEDSLATVRARGGLTLPVTELADGSRLAPCEDPQRAAFGVYQRPR